MSRVSDLENKVAALERNVGMLAKEACLDNCLMISDFSSISKYKDGIEWECAPIKNDKGAFNIRETKTAFVINGTPIYEYDGEAIYDLHIPAGTHYLFRGNICVSTGIIRGLNKNDVVDIILEDHSDFYDKDIIQDMHNPSDLYVIDKIK